MMRKFNKTTRRNHGWLDPALFVVLLSFIYSNPAMAQSNLAWFGSAGDRDFSNSSNWNLGFVPESADLAHQFAVHSTQGPIIDETVNVARIGIAWGNSQSGPTVYWEVTDGGNVNCGGVVEVGRDATNGGHGQLDITGGQISTTDLTLGAGGNSNGRVNLLRGQIKISGNLSFGSGGTGVLNIENGILTLPGNKISQVATWNSNGQIVAYQGSGTLDVNYNSQANQTTVAAQSDDKVVMIFYSCWANETVSTYDNDVYIMGQTPYSPYPQWNYWGKPLYAATHGDGTIKNNYQMYFGSPSNPNDGLIDWHAELLVDAGVDVIVLDLTNGTQTNIINGAKAVCQRYEERFNQGLPTPKIVPWVKDEATLQHIESQLFNSYSSDIFFEYLGKKFVNVGGGNNPPAIPNTGTFANYTCRRMWGLDTSGNYWQFKVNSSTPPPAFTYNGSPEQMCAPVATQASYMTSDGVNPHPGAVGRQNGSYFISYMDAAIATQPKFLFVHSWNEWATQNLGSSNSPTFTDAWGTEYNADIEPMEGGHGWQYYDLMKQKIAEYKYGSTSLQAENYSSMSGILTEATSDVGGGDNVGWIDTNDWISFNNVNIPLSGQYKISYRVASINSNRSFQLEGNGGNPVYGSLTVPNTGSWQSFTTITHTVTLNAGTQTFRIKALGSGWNINWWSITPVSTSGSRLTVQVDEMPRAEETLELQHPFPNPFMERVQFSVPKDIEYVDIQIFNMSGALIRRISQVGEGTDPYWDGTSEAGQKLPTGIYHYQIKTNLGSKSGKIIKAK